MSRDLVRNVAGASKFQIVRLVTRLALWNYDWRPHKVAQTQPNDSTPHSVGTAGLLRAPEAFQVRLVSKQLLGSIVMSWSRLLYVYGLDSTTLIHHAREIIASRPRSTNNHRNYFFTRELNLQINSNNKARDFDDIARFVPSSPLLFASYRPDQLNQPCSCSLRNYIPRVALPSHKRRRAFT